MSCQYFLSMIFILGLADVLLIFHLFFWSCLVMCMTFWSFITCEELDELFLSKLNEFGLTHNEWVASINCWAVSGTCSESLFVVVIKVLYLFQVVFLNFLHIFLWSMTSVMLTIVRSSMSRFLRFYFVFIFFWGQLQRTDQDHQSK